MTSIKQLKLAQKGAVLQQRAISELNALARDIERCEKAIVNLQRELEAVNSKHQGTRTTREDVAYLSALLECAKKKLTWEKQMASVQKRTPVILEEISKLINDPINPPPDPVREEMVLALRRVQAAMERLQTARADACV